MGQPLTLNAAVSRWATEADGQDMRANWRRRAACLGLARLMDPPPDKRSREATKAALKVCRACPVWRECRDWVLSLRQPQDPECIAGATTPTQRAEFRYRRAAHLPKQCPRCLRSLTRCDFYLARHQPDLCHHICKDCTEQARGGSP